MKFTRCAILAVASAVAAFAQLPSTKVLTLEVAQAIAQEAMAKCHADGFKVTVHIVDTGNVLKVFLRDDGTPRSNVEFARMKAAAAVIYGRPSGPPASLPAGAPVPPPAIPGTTNGAGGVPIKVGDQLIGAIGVSGAPSGDKDAACANFALAKLADRLK
jgi:uncharacterized protein GlcG (DUF336 family)